MSGHRQPSRPQAVNQDHGPPQHLQQPQQGPLQQFRQTNSSPQLIVQPMRSGEMQQIGQIGVRILLETLSYLSICTLCLRVARMYGKRCKCSSVFHALVL
jgi:hypothetical protein